MNIAVVVNPLAGGGRCGARFAARLAAITPNVFVTAPDELVALAHELRRVDVLALCGGDGTTHAVLTALEQARVPFPRLALLGGGTINTIARNLGVVGDPEDNLARLVARSNGPLPTSRQTLLRVHDGTQARLGFLFAALLGARFLARYYDHPRPGPARALRLAAEVALSAIGGAPSDVFDATKLALTLDGRALTLDTARLLVASTVPDVGVGMRIAPRARDLPGRFQLVAAGIAPSDMARQIPAVQAGQRLRGEAVVDELCTRAIVDFERDEPYTLDGDLYRARGLTVEAAGPVEIVRA